MNEASESPDLFDDDIEERFADSVGELRKARGWSQERLAEMMIRHGLRDATALTVSRIESRRRKVRLAEAVALASAFEVPILAMTKPDRLSSDLIALSGRAHQLRWWRSELIDAAEKYASRAFDTASAMLSQIEMLRERFELDEESARHLRRYETRARMTLAESPSEIVAASSLIAEQRLDEHQSEG